MDRGSVDYIASASAARIKELTENGVVTTTRVVDGFELEVNSPVDSFSKSYDADSEKLLETLARAGVEPLAVLPTKWWNKIVDDSGLHVVRGGEIRLDLAGMIDALPVTLMMFVSSFLAIVVAPVAVLRGTFLVTGNADLAMILGVSFFFGGFAASIWGAIEREGPVRKLALWMAIRVFLLQGKARILKKYWDGYSDFAVKFPKPDAKTSALIVKLKTAGLDFQVAAETGAIRLATSLSSRLTQAALDRDVKLREERARLRADPIIFMTHGTATVLVAQYGDFPIEKSTIDRAVRGFGM